LLGDEYGAVLLAFAADHELAALEVDVIGVEVGKFGHTEAAGEEQLYDGPVAQSNRVGSVYGSEEAFNLAGVEEGDFGAGDFGEFDFGGVEGFYVAFGEVFQEAAEGDEVVILGGLGEFVTIGVLGAVEVKAPLADHFGIELGNVAIVGEFDQPGEVVVVIGNGFLGTVLLNLQMLQKVGNEIGQW